MRIWLFNYIALQRTYKNVRHLCGTQPSPSDPPVGPLGHYVFYSAITYARVYFVHRRYNKAIEQPQTPTEPIIYIGKYFALKNSAH